MNNKISMFKAMTKPNTLLINTPLQRGNCDREWQRNRFNGFDVMRETVETVPHTLAPPHTLLKRGVNDSRHFPASAVSELCRLSVRRLMSPISRAAFLGLALAFTVSTVQAKLNVVATLPDFGAIAQEIGGDRIKVTTIARGTEDQHFVDARPSYIRNPHFSLDPANGKIIANALAETFSRLDPANAAYFRANLQKFNERLDKKLAEWTSLLEPYRGSKVVTYHKSFDYVLERFGLEAAGTIEPKPGIEPSPTYINALIPRLKGAGVKLVMIEPFRPRKTPEYVAHAIGARLLLVPGSVGGNQKVTDYFSLFDYIVAQIAAGLKESK